MVEVSHMMGIDSSREILSPAQTAEFLQVSQVMVYRLIRAGDIKAKRFGKFWRISKSAILRSCENPKRKS